MRETIEMLVGVRSCIEQLKVSGRGDCAMVIACCNTIDKVVKELENGGEAEE